MLIALLCCSALPDLQDVQGAEERLKRRITPVVQVAESASPAVVYIATDKQVNVLGPFEQHISGAGSGVVIMKEGFIITNYHVIKDAQKIAVYFNSQLDDPPYPADVVSFVPQEDLALIKIRCDRDCPTIPLGTSADLMPGETVIAIGNPVGQTHTVSQGIISGLHRNVQIRELHLQFSDLIQTDASINSGNSGGPLLNINGEMVGLNSAMMIGAQNIAFAIPVDRIKDVLQDQLLSPDTAAAWLGFDVEPGDHLQIARVVAGSPASQAGLKPGDCVVAIDGRPVTKQDDYRLARIAVSPQLAVDLQVERSGATRKFRLKAWDKTDGVLFERLGFRVEQSPRHPYFLRVTEIRPQGPGDVIGLQVGDLFNTIRPILSGRNIPPLRVGSREQLAGLVSPLSAGTEIELEVRRSTGGDRLHERDEVLQGTLTMQ
jgi:serine protease Do